MNDKQIPQDVLRLLVPDDSFDTEDFPDPDAESIALDDARDQLARQLSNAADEDGPIDDPLLAALNWTTARYNAAALDRRLLIAYAREFAPPRRYPMEALAPYAGMSGGNIRKGKAYNDGDINTVARMLGRVPPGEPADPELAAINAYVAILDGQSPEARATTMSDLTVGTIHNQHPELTLPSRVRVLDYLQRRYNIEGTSS